MRAPAFTQAISPLGVALRQRLSEFATITPPRILSEKKSIDGTVKWLMACGAGNAIETVFIPEPARGTLCISSQVGCALNCSFCSTGAQGFSRNLATGDVPHVLQIVDQFHAGELIWDLGQAPTGVGAAQTTAWVDARLARLAQEDAATLASEWQMLAWEGRRSPGATNR